MRHGVPGGVKATPTVFSASPYTGDMAWRLKPHFSNLSEKAFIVSGLTGSAPLKAKRQVERSMPSISLSGIRRRHNS
jgi:hypothetical protein